MKQLFPLKTLMGPKFSSQINSTPFEAYIRESSLQQQCNYSEVTVIFFYVYLISTLLVVAHQQTNLKFKHAKCLAKWLIYIIWAGHIKLKFSADTYKIETNKQTQQDTN